MKHTSAFQSERGFFRDVGAELDAAREKHPDEEGVLTDAEWLAVLTEEVGECARAIQDETDVRLRAELVQVAAMAMRWALSIPLGRATSAVGVEDVSRAARRIGRTSRRHARSARRRALHAGRS